MRKRNRLRSPAPGGSPPESAPAPSLPRQAGGAYWLYGRHAVAAALRNERRRILRLAGVMPLDPPIRQAAAARGLEAEPFDPAALDRLLPRGSVHQGVAALVEPLPLTDLGEVLDALPAGAPATVLLLDQVTDPHNVGAILRSAAAFGAAAVILTERNAAPEGGVLAKAASGGLERVPLVRVINLARTMDALKAAGFWCVGLAAEAERPLPRAELPDRLAIALGSEGEGLRRLTRERCDFLLRLPTMELLAQINVSNAAAVALYEVVRRRGLPPGTETP